MEAHEIFSSLPFCLHLYLDHFAFVYGQILRKDEFCFILLGITGGWLYFITENMAVKMDYVTNVSFIVCTAPLLTAILALLF